jgi:hypothetical protein
MNLETIAEKLRGLASDARGALEFLALFLREDSLGLWDVVVAAPWLKTGEAKSFEYVAERLRKLLTKNEIAGVSRIVILEHGGAVLSSYLDQFANQFGFADIHFVTEDVIRRAYIIVACPPSSSGAQVAEKRRRKRQVAVARRSQAKTSR